MQLGMRYDTDSCSLIPCDIKFNSKTGYWYRPETFDHGMIKDSKKHYSALQHVKGSVVLDLGANCGGFTKMAIDAEAKMVVALEPCPYNFQILCLNAPQAINIPAAICEYSHPEIEFFYSDSKRSSSSSSTIKRRNASGISIKVPGISINDLLNKWKPAVVKMDIESKEYDILDAMEKIPEYIQEFAVEFHKFSSKCMVYPEKYFPKDKWEWETHGFKFFGTWRINDYIFRRKNGRK